jgi:hypothetical protein
VNIHLDYLELTLIKNALSVAASSHEANAAMMDSDLAQYMRHEARSMRALLATLDNTLPRFHTHGYSLVPVGR